MGNIKVFFTKYIEVFTIIGLAVLCYFMFFHGIGNYALMDVDETRYVAMARDMFNSKDFLTLYLNGDYFFEKPPLYFWGECLSFALFGKINEFTARFPVSLYGTLSVFLVYLTGRKVVDRNYGLISALILATSLEFLILAKFAILDIVVTTCIGFSIFFGFMTFFCREETKKYFWWLFYIFSALAVMAKGIPGFIVPFGVMFFTLLAAGSLKDAFKKIYLIPGIILFLAIVLPWHIVMLKLHNPLFFEEYIVKHHLHRFVDSKELGRKEPFYFYMLTFLWGFFPWILSAITVGISKIKDAAKIINLPKFVYYNVIAFVFTMLFFSISSTKLITYILPLYFFSACIIGFVWHGYLTEEKFKKPIDISVYIIGGVCVLASIAMLFSPLFLPKELYQDILSAKWFCIILLASFGIASIVFAAKNKRVAVFVSYILFMTILSGFGTEKFFKIDYKFGQDDLMEYAKYSQKMDYKLATFGFGRRFSLLYYQSNPVKFIQDMDYELLGECLSDNDTVVVVKNKQLEELEEHDVFFVIKKGRKYSLIK